MNATYTFKQNNPRTSFLKLTATLAIGIGIGYTTKQMQNTNEGYTVKNGMLERQEMPSRELTTENGVIQVGTTKERVNDLLYENPAVIKKTVEELYGAYMNE